MKKTDLIVDKVNKDYVKRQELDNILRNKGISAASGGLMNTDLTSERGLSLETILTGQAKHNAAFQMASGPAMIFHG